jgi:hypothetical protein
MSNTVTGCAVFAASARNVVTAAATGLAVMPICEATLETASGRSGLMRVRRETSAMTGRSAYTAWPVPTHTVRKNVESGARIVTRFGCARSTTCANPVAPMCEAGNSMGCRAGYRWVANRLQRLAGGHHG